MPPKKKAAPKKKATAKKAPAKKKTPVKKSPTKASTAKPKANPTPVDTEESKVIIEEPAPVPE